MRAQSLRNRYVRGEWGLQGSRGVCGGGGQCWGEADNRFPVSPAWRSNMADKTKVAEQYYAPPPDLGKWESFRIFLWNSETGQFLGRTGSSWGESVLFFFTIFSLARFGGKTAEAIRKSIVGISNSKNGVRIDRKR